MNSIRKILIVDDDKNVLTICKYSLEQSEGLEIRCAESGEEALKVALEYLPDVILLDILMPKMDGIETYKAIRKISSLAKCVVIFLTASASQEKIKEYLKVGNVALITKPFDPLRLGDKVQTLYEHLSYFEEQKESKNLEGIPEKLLTTYRASIPKKLALLEELIKDYKERRGIEELNALYFALHKLAGSSGVYGFLNVSKICVETKAKIHEWQRLFPKIPEDQIITELQLSYEEIKNSFH
ncbi:MAG TPA: response regulator [Chlamydiales bacterium]|nr:MAG: hypothetical protein A3F67_09385 [Verrucomicrobia bacterium RIFCSPHIGHO2_12_FULL_41_10]HLB52291.1 response regulator [Chlamydiales bacterium]